jgi:hypothetical protein
MRLDTLQQKLGDIFAVQVPIKATRDVERVEFRCRDVSWARSPVIKYIQSSAPVLGLIFTNSHFEDEYGWRIKRIELLDELTYRETSNGNACRLAVCRGECKGYNDSKSMQAAFKFRMVETANEHFSEKEASHAILVDMNPEVRKLFPELFCLAKVITEEEGRRRLWECIGTQLLNENSETRRSTDPFFMLECFRLLKKLHSLGYIHGDAHGRNFMEDIATRRILLIDQDEIRPLSTNPTVCKYMQILDYLMLLFWNNLHIDYTYILETRKQPANIQSPLFEAGVLFFQEYTPMSVLFPPFGAWYHRKKTDDMIELDLKSKYATVKNSTYWRFLASLDTSEIDAKFEEVFTSINGMRALNDKIKRTLRAHGFRV